MKNTDEKYRAILEHIGDGFISYDVAGNFTYVNRKAGELLGMQPEELIGKSVWAVFPKEDYPEFYETFQNSMRDQKYLSMESYYAPKDVWYESHYYPSPKEMTVFFRDITEKKKQATSVLNEKNLSDTIINELPGIFYMADRTDFSVLRWNKNLEIISGYSADEIRKMKTLDFVEPAQHEYARSQRQTAIEEGKVGAELSLVTKNKTRLDYYFKVMPIIHNGQPRMLGIGIDITEQKKSENALLQKNYEINERMKELSCLYKLSEITADPLNSMDDIMRKCTEIIPAAWQYPEITCTRIRFHEHSYRSENFVETRWVQESDIIANNVRAGKVEVFYKELMPIAQEGPFLKEERLLINSIAEMLGNSADRKNAEETLRKTNEDMRKLNAHLQTVREEERTRIARDIHDELGQRLTGLKMQLTLCTKRMREGNKTPDADVAEINRLIDDTVESVKRIASELRPGILDDFGLSAAMEWQTTEFEKHTGIQCNLSFSPGEIIFEKDIATTVFRIYQESLTNVMRYAKATRVESSLENNGSEIKLVVKDNGEGFDMKKVQGKKTLGLLGMQERAHTLGGQLNVDSKTGRGTTISLSIPLTTHHQKVTA